MLLFLSLQQFGKILDVEIIFNERGSKVSPVSVSGAQLPLTRFISTVSIQRAKAGPCCTELFPVSSLGQTLQKEAADIWRVLGSKRS